MRKEKITLSKEQVSVIAELLRSNGITQVFNSFNIVGDPLLQTTISGIDVYQCMDYGYADIPSITEKSAKDIEKEILFMKYNL